MYNLFIYILYHELIIDLHGGADDKEVVEYVTDGDEDSQQPGDPQDRQQGHHHLKAGADWITKSSRHKNFIMKQDTTACSQYLRTLIG